ncbi:MAG TPA: tetratricopeptide repeat protein [Dyella sp.]|uniref:YfgM family protein n=1 Tax=Dyella sp. TaxID=1869338 RepID=UPI002D78E34D|nr:tetratricopeptide repeat protein [Dyella sp.]HET6554755.1 tetratricopeptide repeat protein [Dyella sp.]
MAFEAYDEYEQSERVQQWLRQNGLSIVVGIAIGLVGIFGWQQWNKHKADHQAEAANLYQQLSVAAAAGKNEGADTLTERLVKDYPDTAYALFAMGDRAQRQVQAKQLDKALESLGWAESHASDANLKALMQLRSARVLLAQGKGAEALAALDRMAPKSYEGVAQELRGDVLVKLGRPDDARKAYEAAKAALGENAPQSVQMKIDDLAVAGKQGA